LARYFRILITRRRGGVNDDISLFIAIYFTEESLVTDSAAGVSAGEGILPAEILNDPHPVSRRAAETGVFVTPSF